MTPEPLNIDSSRFANAEAALRLSEATKSAILETALDCIVTIDHRGTVVDWNPAAERTFGYQRTEAIGQEMAALIIPAALQDRHRQGVAKAVRSGHDQMAGRRIEITARKKSGEEIPVELAITRVAGGEAPLFTGHIRDITDRKRREQLQTVQYTVTRTLAESPSLAEAAPGILRAVCEGLRWDFGALWRVDPVKKLMRCIDLWIDGDKSSGAFAAASRKATFKSGLGLPGRIWLDGQPRWLPDVARDRNFPRAEIAAENGLHSAFGFPIRLGAQVLGVMEFFSHEIRQPNTEILEMFAAIGSQIGQFIQRTEAEAHVHHLNRDLERRIIERTSELTQAQQDLVKALEQEKDLSRLKTNFVNLVSHEFRTPLGIIMSSADIIENYFDRLTGEQRRDHLQDIRHSARQMTGLMEEVLLLGRVESGKMECRVETFDLSDFCTRLVDEQLSATNRKCPIEIELGKIPGRAVGDEGLLRHVFTNLLSNAVKYSPAGNLVKFSMKCEDSEAVFEIRDRGIGIPMEDQTRLFEAFHRGRNVGEITGTGLGLVIVKRCVDLHGGKITLNSRVGSGTTFIVRFKLFKDATRKSRASSGRKRK